MKNLKHSVLSLLSLSLIAAPAAFANTATLADLGAQTLGGTTFTVTGASNPNFGCNCFSMPVAGTYTSATDSTMPANGQSIIQLAGNNTVTIQFSAPVTDLLLYEFSLGGAGITSTYTFSSTPTILSSGGNGLYTEYNGGNFTIAGNTISGDEANGTIEFTSPISTLTINVTNGENYNGFELGVLNTAATPEPESLVLVGTGLIGLAGMIRRRMSR